MARPLLLLTAALVTVGFSGCLTDDASFKDVPTPQLQSGFAYAFISSGNEQWTETEDGETHSESQAIDPTTRLVEILNTGYESEEEKLYLAAVQVKMDDVEAPTVEDSGSSEIPASPAVTMPQPQMTWLSASRQRDLMDVPVSYGRATSCNGSECTNSIGKLTFGSALPMTRLDFPLTKGKTWTGEMDIGDMDGPNDDLPESVKWLVRAKVAGPATIDLPMGRTDTVRVEYLFSLSGIDEWKKAVMAEAKEEGVRLDVFQYSGAIRIQSYYSEAYQNVVREEVVETVNMRVKGTEDGHAFDYGLSARLDYTDQLAGARLVPRPERDLNYITGVVFGKIPVTDAMGAAYQPVGYSLSLNADKTVINAAKAESIKFTAELVGLDALPEDHQVDWRVTAANGKQLAAGKGLTFEQKFEQPGQYSVEIEATDAAGVTTAVDGTTITANFEDERTLNCGPLTVYGFPTNCAKIQLPIHLGIQSAEVQARLNTPLAPASRNQLQLTDPAGNTVSDGSHSGGLYEVSVSDFSEFLLNDADWTLFFNEQIAPLQTVTLTIKLSYGEDAATLEPGEASPASSGPGLSAQSRGKFHEGVSRIPSLDDGHQPRFGFGLA